MNNLIRQKFPEVKLSGSIFFNAQSNRTDYIKHINVRYDDEMVSQLKNKSILTHTFYKVFTHTFFSPNAFYKISPILFFIHSFFHPKFSPILFHPFFFSLILFYKVFTHTLFHPYFFTHGFYKVL